MRPLGDGIMKMLQASLLGIAGWDLLQTCPEVHHVQAANIQIKKGGCLFALPKRRGCFVTWAGIGSPAGSTAGEARGGFVFGPGQMLRCSLY